MKREPRLVSLDERAFADFAVDQIAAKGLNVVRDLLYQRLEDRVAVIDKSLARTWPVPERPGAEQLRLDLGRGVAIRARHYQGTSPENNEEPTDHGASSRIL